MAKNREQQSRVDFEGDQRLANLRAHLEAAVIGQESAIETVHGVLLRGELGLTTRGRPLGTFLFLGPTGVGKTQLAKSAAEYLFGDSGFAVFDMSEFQGPDAVRQMIGGETDKGRFARTIERVGSKGFILFDEIEKADRGVLDLFLQILDKGSLTLASGVHLDLTGFYIAMTSNISSEAILKAQGGSPTALQRFVQSQAETYLRPELYGRIDKVLVFSPLTFPTRVAIGQMIADRESERLRQLGIVIDELPRDSVVALCAREGRLGIRPLRNRIEEVLQQQAVQKIRVTA